MPILPAPPPDQPTDGELADAITLLQQMPVVAGRAPTPEQDRACWCLCGALAGRLVRTAQACGLMREAAREVVNAKLFVLVTRDIRRLQPTRVDLERWMTAVVRNGARTRLREEQRRWRGECSCAADALPDAPDESEAFDAEARSTGDSLEHLSPWLKAALDTLSPATRALVMWRYVEGVTTREAAAAYEHTFGECITVSAVDKPVCQAKPRLRRACTAARDRGKP